jgi:hypothetical protein
MRKLTLRSATTALAGILIAIGGCTESPSAPATPSAPQFVIRSSHLRFDVSGSASAVIGVAGGTVVTPAGDRLIFPVGALAQPTEITLTSSDSYVGVQVQPHGLTFAPGRQPVLVLNTAGSNAGSFRKLEVSYVDESGNVAEVFPAAAGAETLTTTLPHFSGFLASGH